jgi:hypothetical protein
MGKIFLGLYIHLILILLFSCSTPPRQVETEPAPEQTPPIVHTAPVIQDKPEISVEPEKKEKEVEPELVPPPKESVIKTEDTAIEITQEEYAKTFEEVERVIEELNSIIKAGDFHRWTTYLTTQFAQTIMNPENLERVNEQPVLKRNKIVIKSLSDYFTYVVAPSRASVRLDDLIFTDLDRVKAFMIIRGDRVLIYQLEKISEKWKISTW